MQTTAFSFINRPLSFYASRFLAHFFVLSALLIHQFLVVSFIDVKLSVFVYFLCFCVFTIDSLCLFFYKQNQNKEVLNSFLLFIDALFLSALLIVMDAPFNLFFVFVLLFFHSTLLVLSQRVFHSLIFLLYLSVLFPLALSFFGYISFQERVSLVLFINISFLFLFLFNYFVKTAFLFIAGENSLQPESSLISSDRFQPIDYAGFSLDLCRKLKPGLNALIKYFPEEYRSSQGFFSVSKGRQQLEQMRRYVSNFIEYAEPEIDSLLEEYIDLKSLLQKLLKKMEKHPQRPENLNQRLELPDTFKVQGSVPHLNKCFEHILVNSFEALKNQNEPKMNVRGWLEKEQLFLEFKDNGHGIKSDDMKKLFDPLFSQRFGLRGLGLPYVKKIIQAHKASLDISSSREGTKILITFPLNYNSYDQAKPKLKKKIA